MILLCALSRRQCISQRKIIFARVWSIKFPSEQSLRSKCLLQNIVSFPEISHGCLFIRYSWAVFWYTGTGLAHLYPVGICTDHRLGELAYFQQGYKCLKMHLGDKLFHYLSLYGFFLFTWGLILTFKAVGSFKEEQNRITFSQVWVLWSQEWQCFSLKASAVVFFFFKYPFNLFLTKTNKLPKR